MLLEHEHNSFAVEHRQEYCSKKNTKHDIEKEKKKKEKRKEKKEKRKEKRDKDKDKGKSVRYQQIGEEIRRKEIRREEIRREEIECNRVMR